MNEEIQDILYRSGLNLSSVSKRATAFFIDELLLSFLLMVALWDPISSAKGIEDIVSITNTFILEYMLMKIVYQAFFVTQYGATLGKIAMKIRVIEVATLQNPSIGSSINRAIFRIVSESFFYLGFLWGFFDPARQTLHDKTAKTLVIDA